MVAGGDQWREERPVGAQFVWSRRGQRMARCNGMLVFLMTRPAQGGEVWCGGGLSVTGTQKHDIARAHTHTHTCNTHTPTHSKVSRRTSGNLWSLKNAHTNTHTHAHTYRTSALGEPRNHTHAHTRTHARTHTHTHVYAVRATERVPTGSCHFLCSTDPSQSVVSFPCIQK